MMRANLFRWRGPMNLLSMPIYPSAGSWSSFSRPSRGRFHLIQIHPCPDRSRYQAQGLRSRVHSCHWRGRRLPEDAQARWPALNHGSFRAGMKLFNSGRTIAQPIWQGQNRFAADKPGQKIQGEEYQSPCNWWCRQESQKNIGVDQHCGRCQQKQATSLGRLLQNNAWHRFSHAGLALRGGITFERYSGPQLRYRPFPGWLQQSGLQYPGYSGPPQHQQLFGGISARDVHVVFCLQGEPAFPGKPGERELHERECVMIVCEKLAKLYFGLLRLSTDYWVILIQKNAIWEF